MDLASHDVSLTRSTCRIWADDEYSVFKTTSMLNYFENVAIPYILILYC